MGMICNKIYYRGTFMTRREELVRKAAVVWSEGRES